VIIGGWRGPGWQVFDADPRLGSQIRDWISSAISGHDCPVDAADAALAVTELFGNAVMHGPAGGRVLVGYRLWREGARLVVCDGGGPSTPRLVHGGELAEGGRGLRVVDSLAARWGQLRPGRCPGGVVRFRAAAPRCGQRRLGLAALGLVRVQPVRPRSPGDHRDARHADCHRGTMSARLSEAGDGLRPEHHLPVERSCRQAPPHHRGSLPGRLRKRAYEPSLPSDLFLVAVFCGNQ
jgi:anti-sigma regulatory factor (Ser/Thr protein kinase)